MENKTATLVAVLCALACINVASSFDSHKCLRYKTAMKNFELNKWSGHWYYARESFFGTSEVTKCIQHVYTPLAQGGFNIRVATHITKSDGSVEYYFGEAIAKMNSNTNEGKFNVTVLHQDGIFSREENSYGEPFYILGTDYRNYAVLYGCKSTEDKDFHYIVILSRTPQLDEQFQRKADEILIAQNLDPSMATNHVQDCGKLLE